MIATGGMEEMVQGRTALESYLRESEMSFNVGKRAKGLQAFRF